MKRLAPWLITAIAVVAFAASFLELQRMRKRLGEVTRHQFHDHSEVREFMIRAALADTTQPIVIIGDSIAEMAPLPRQICNRALVNAGVGGITIHEAQRLAARVVGERGAFMIVLAIGANDASSENVRRDFVELIEAVKPLSIKQIVVISTANEKTNREIGEASAASGVLFVEPSLPPGSLLADRIHYTAAAYGVWVPALEAAISKVCE